MTLVNVISKYDLIIDTKMQTVEVPLSAVCMFGHILRKYRILSRYRKISSQNSEYHKTSESID